MNNIVALMLVALNRNEEAAFWLLAALVEDILYPGTYSRNLEGCQASTTHKLSNINTYVIIINCCF